MNRTSNRGPSWLARLSFALLLVFTTPAPWQTAPAIQGVVAVATTVSDMDRALEFYSHVLEFRKISDVEVAGEGYEHLSAVFGARVRLVTLALGAENIQLQQYLAPPGRPVPADSRSNDLWFQHIAIVVSDMDRAYARLRQNKVQYASTEPQRLPDWNKAAAGIRAFYFKDPDGHPLEIIWFPAGKGMAKWHQSSNKLFLGIDHTAIVVGNTERTLSFYRDLLGMRIVGESENYGTEQEHLNNVFGAHLRITSLRSEQGPGVELLEYLAPRDGRAFPSDEHANDVVDRQTVLLTSDASATAQALFARGVRFVSPGPVSLQGRELGISKAMTVRDPDGHALLIEQK
jgi:catechol 2,3-dioxygenase-like lactoylglutathione lyase family enzyme